MALQFQQVSLRDLARGIDARSVQSVIPEGYSEDLINCDTNSNGYLSKRHGYQGYYGRLPMRVSSVQHDGTNITFLLDGSLNVAALNGIPIVVYGRTSTAHSGDWTTTDASRYYTIISTDVRHTLTAPSGTLTVLEADHLIDTDNVFISTLKSTSDSVPDSEFFFTDSMSISDTDPHDLAVGYTVPADVKAYIYVSDKDAVGGQSFVQLDTISATTTTTISIPTATHALDNFAIITQVYRLVAGAWEQVEPDSVTIDAVTGDVAIIVTNSTGSSVNFKSVLSAAPVANSAAGTISAMGTGTIVASGLGFDFYHAAVYRNTAGVLTKVIPDAIVRASVADTLTFTITNSEATPQFFEIYIEAAEVATATVTVTDTNNVSTSYTDSDPQLTIWGLDHEGAYIGSAGDQAGHVTHIDSYRREGEQRLVSGLGGVLFAARTRAEVGTTYKIPTTDVDLQDRVDTDLVVGPAFQTTGSAAARTRGAVVADDVVDGAALVTGVTVDSAGVATYQLSFTNKVGSLATALSTISPLQDWITITGMARSIHNGTFAITAVSNSANTITVSNPALPNIPEFNESGARARGAVFTDQIVLAEDTEFLPDDTIMTSASDDYTVVTADAATIVVADVETEVSLPAGLAVYGARLTDLVPIVDVTNFVKGDMMTVRGFAREMRASDINAGDNLDITSITETGGVATVTTSTNHHLRTGMKILVLQTGVDAYNGPQTITTLISDTVFEFATTGTGTASGGVIRGNVIQLDESVLVADDGIAPTSFGVTGRWIPIEAPDTTDTLPETTHFSYFDTNEYSAQPTLRSTMVADNLYVTNGDDEVHKFDGTDIYRAGLPRWQPQLFTTVDTTTASIPIRSTQAVLSGAFWEQNKFVVDFGDGIGFAIGDRISNSEDNQIYTILSKGDDGSTEDYLFVDRDISGTASAETIQLVSRYRYYFRLNAIDANQNIVASAATGLDDFLVDLPTAGQIHMRLVGMPTWGTYDYDRIEVQVYRTAANTPAPFYLIRTVDLSFSAGAGYVDIEDGTPDDSLSDLDVVNTALLGAEVGTTWSAPIKAKHVTTADNRLILANLRDYPQIDITVRKQATAAAVTAANLTGKRWLFRRDSSDTGTTTSMPDRAAYEWVNSGAVTIVPSDITRSGTTFTIHKATHGLAIGDWVYLFHSAAGTDNNMRYAGWWQIQSVTTDTFTILFTNTYTVPSADDCDRYVTAAAQEDIPVWIGTDGNRAQVDANSISEFTAVLRLAEAINASMRLTDVSITGQSDFVPWIIAGAGSEFGVGRLVVRQERVESVVPEVVTPATITNADVFVNDVRRSASTAVSASSQLMSSRLILSYPNFPEIFDAPAGLQSESDSVVDVNSADGQEITGIIPFFGDSVFGAGQVEAALVVFKTNSIYLLDVATRRLSKIESRGLGCTAPYSIASTRDGIMFANESGIYRLNRDQSISYVGRNMERLWEDSVNRQQLTAATGHHYGVGRKYKLSVPVGDDQETNNHVYVYDHEREGRDQEFGAWTRYTNHAATGWANLATDAFFGTTNGQVYKVRVVGDSTDYRDDADAVAEMQLILRPEDFGQAGIRKAIASVTSHFQMRRSSQTATMLSIGPDLDGSFADAGTISITKTPAIKVANVMASPPSRRMEYLQLKYTNAVKDEDVVLAGVDYSVAALYGTGIPQVAETE